MPAPPSQPSAYLAGPDVFLPEAQAHAARKVAICARYGILGRPPLNDDIVRLMGLPEEEAWQAIYRKDVEMMEACDLAIINLTPFRGASADSGTLVELGWFLGRGKPAWAYSNSATPFLERSRAQVAAVPDPMPGLAVEGFGLPDNLMVPGAVQDCGGHPVVLPEDGRDRAFDALDVFERCVALAAATLGCLLDGADETAHLLRSPANARHLRQSIASADAGQTTEREPHTPKPNETSA